MPHPSYFPFSTIQVDALVPNSFGLNTPEERRSGTLPGQQNMVGPEEETIPFVIKKYPENPDDINLAVALQYGAGMGSVQLRKIIKAFVERVYQPAYEDYEILMNTGNTDG